MSCDLHVCDGEHCDHCAYERDPHDHDVCDREHDDPYVHACAPQHHDAYVHVYRVHGARAYERSPRGGGACAQLRRGVCGDARLSRDVRVYARCVRGACGDSQNDRHVCVCVLNVPCGSARVSRGPRACGRVFRGPRVCGCAPGDRGDCDCVSPPRHACDCVFRVLRAYARGERCRGDDACSPNVPHAYGRVPLFQNVCGDGTLLPVFSSDGEYVLLMDSPAWLPVLCFLVLCLVFVE